MFIPDPNVSHPRSRILDPNFFHPGSLIWIFSISDPRSRMHIKEFKYFNQKNGFSALINMIQVFHPGSGSWIWICTELVFCQASAQKSITSSFFNNWLWKKVSRCSPSSIFRIFHTIGLLSPPESEIRAGKLLVDLGHLKEELAGGRPHHHYIKACRRHPRLERGLQKKYFWWPCQKITWSKCISKMNHF